MVDVEYQLGRNEPVTVLRLHEKYAESEDDPECRCCLQKELALGATSSGYVR
jgi:hypothetical protein